MMVTLVLLLLLLDKVFLIFGEENTKDDNLLIKISNGLIQGRKGLTADFQKEYFAFQGIPYAKPPIGDLRFSAPVAAEDWPGVLDATKDRAGCIQLLNEGSEDCLFISVYTSKIDPSNLLPVMVWLYGGFFLLGDSNYTDYGPDYFLNEGVVIVTLNYRLTALGFLCTEDMAAVGNWGLKDQLLALKWVKKNIGAFGGDPGRVTIFGESAGSASVSYLTQTHLANGLFHRAIMQSGTSLNLWALARSPRITAFELGKSLGIITDNSTYLVEKLRKVDYRKLHTVSLTVDALETTLTNPRNGLIFAPCVEPNHKDAVVLGKSHTHLEKGLFNKVPMIIGFNSQEGIIIQNILDRVRLYLLTFDAFPNRLIPVDMNISPINIPAVALKIRTKYFGIGLLTLNPNSLVQYITDDQFVRPISEAVRHISGYAPVYFYRFSYQGSLGLPTGVDGRKYSGVSHAEELLYFWRNSMSIQNPTRTDILTRRRLLKLWTNFAKTSNPTPEPNPLLQNVTWAPAAPNNQHYLDIGLNLTIGSSLDGYSVPWWKNLYEQYGNPPYDTY